MPQIGQEDITKRTRNAKHLYQGLDGQGREKYEVKIHAAPIHYEDDAGVLQNIDGSLVNDTSIAGFNCGCESTGLPIRIDTASGKRRIYPVRSDRSKYIKFSGLPGLTGGVRGGNTITWDKANFTLKFTVGRFIKLDYTLKNASAPKSISFDVSLVGLTYDNPTGEVRNNGVAVAWIKKPFAVDANDTVRNLNYSYSAGKLSVALDDTGLVYPIIIDPSISPFAGETDGCALSGAYTVWADARNANPGNTTYAQIYAISYLSSLDYYIYRAFLPFDTSAIPDTATVDSATLNLYGQAKVGNGEVTHIVSTSLTAMDDTGDYNITNYGGTSAGSFPASPTLEAYNSSAVSLAVITINKTGSTYIALRGANDFNNTAPTGGDYTYYYHADTAGTTKDPYLTVNYTEAGGGAATGFMTTNSKFWGT